MSELTSAPSRAVDGLPEPSTLAWVVAGLSTGAAVIHFAMVPIHAGGNLLDPLGFAVAGWFQLWIAAAVLTGRAGRKTFAAAVVGNIAITGAWVWSRTIGLPYGEHKGIVEAVGAVDVTCQILGMGAAVLAARLLLAPEATGERSGSRLAPAFAAAAAIALATTVISSPDAANHGGTTTTTVDPTSHAAQMALLDKTRCDKGFNEAAYWKETKTLGIDTYQGGAMSADTTDPTAATATSSDGHAHSHGAATPAAVTTTTQPDPTGGRGSETLDKLIGMTESAGVSEAGAAQLVIALGEVSDKEYGNWLWWLRSSGTVGHAHAATAPGDTGGHGGHVGPQPWTAMTSKTQCNRLSSELAVARATAMKYDTVAKAEAGGWRKVTGYVPGIAAHYMKFSIVDGTFAVDQPEMLLYDGDHQNSHIVGLSYYLIHEGEAEPTQGFTGAEDHFHRHIGLCIKDGVVIADSTTTEAECAALGGAKSGGSKGWMSHAWVVPGCESPWGVFSPANPVLDGALSKDSGNNAGGCATSGVRARYDMGSTATATAAAGAGESEAPALARAPGN